MHLLRPWPHRVPHVHVDVEADPCSRETPTKGNADTALLVLTPDDLRGGVVDVELKTVVEVEIGDVLHQRQHHPCRMWTGSESGEEAFKCIGMEQFVG